jgi:serine/threonine-protein kinase RsbW
MRSLRLPAEVESLESFRSFVMEEIGNGSYQRDVSERVDLVLEEVLVNIISYAYEDKGFIEVEVDPTDPEGLMLAVMDWGIPFNPMDRGDPDFTREIPDMEIGGLGIHLVRRMASEVKYERKDGANVLTMIFRNEAN